MGTGTHAVACLRRRFQQLDSRYNAAPEKGADLLQFMRCSASTTAVELGVFAVIGLQLRRLLQRDVCLVS
jgi:hypothetical protein